MEEKDLSKIFVSDEPRECTIEYKGQKFCFKFKELPWALISKIASKSLDYTGKKVVMDKSEFDILCLEASLVEAPWPLDKTRYVVKRLNTEFGELLRKAIVPEPYLADNEALKNE
jgi:hypothetical protein